VRYYSNHETGSLVDSGLDGVGSSGSFVSTIYHLRSQAFWNETRYSLAQYRLFSWRGHSVCPASGSCRPFGLALGRCLPKVRIKPNFSGMAVVGYFEFPADPLAKATYQSVAMPRKGINIKTDSQGLNPHFLKIRQNGTSSTKAILTINSRCIG
jgi:hypothetical protein